MFLCGGQAAPSEALRVIIGLRECCMGAFEGGPADCTCWEPVFEVDQAELQRGLVAGTRTTACSDCAYRPDSPERAGDERYMGSAPGELERLAAGAGTFWCHDGMRKPKEWRHSRLGIVVPATGDFYDPPMVDVDGEAIPFKADGTPGDRCAGWAARRAALAQVSPEGVADGDEQADDDHHADDAEEDSHEPADASVGP